MYVCLCSSEELNMELEINCSSLFTRHPSFGRGKEINQNILFISVLAVFTFWRRYSVVDFDLLFKIYTK